MTGEEGSTMARGEKTKYTDKQKRQAEHIEEGYEKRGVSTKEAERRAWQVVDVGPDSAGYPALRGQV